MQKQTYRNSVLLGIAVLVFAAMFAGCGGYDGSVDVNKAPVVSFVTVPLDSSEFNFAPVIYWKGNDPDGFVEYYSYADITDEAALENPVEFYEQIPNEAWVDTIATEARIYLLTDAGDTTEHVFYVRCFDNEGMVNDGVIYRTFFRSNQAPSIPRVGVTGEPDDSLLTHKYIGDTLFSATEVTETWGGIQFSWRGTDPDDKALYKIPLQFQPILVKSPGDTVFTKQWSDAQDIVLTNLDTGFYTLYIWARDDGFTLSSAPARVEFNVIRPTFENNLLIILEMPDATYNMPPPDTLKNFYTSLIEEVAQHDSLADVDLLFDGVDVRFLNLEGTLTRADQVVPKSLIHQYKVVVMAADQFYRGNIYNQRYTQRRNEVFLHYLQVGGRVWLQGRTLGSKVLPIAAGVNSDQEQLLFDDYLAISNVTGLDLWTETALTAYSEFIGSRTALEGEFTSMDFDTSKAAYNWFGYVDSLNYGQTGVEILGRGAGAVTTQYFNSLTDTYMGYVESDPATIPSNVTIGGVEYTYPAWETGCFVQTTYDNVYPDSVKKVHNITKLDAGEPNWEGQVVSVNNNIIQVSYEQGGTWKATDSLSVEYWYNPLSIFHLKPVEIRHEEVETIDFTFSQLRYRTAISTFSYFFMEREEVVDNWATMLSWFFDSRIHFD